MMLQLARTRSTERIAEIPLSRGHACVFEHARDVPMEIWARGFADTPKDFQYYELLEQTMGWPFEYRYLAVFDEADRPVALQPLVLTTQDLVASANETLVRVVAKLRRLWPSFLRSRMALAGCLVGEGKTGAIESVEVVIPLVAEALEKYARGQEIFLVAFKDFPRKIRGAFSCLNRSGYARAAGFPSLTLELDFASFDEYMATHLSRATRKNLRRKFRYFIWRQGSRAVAFSFCTIWNETLYDNDIGLDYSVAYELNLYYLTFRDLLNWALANGLRRYASAPFDYDPKLRLRLQLQPVDIYAKHTSLWLNPLIKVFARLFEPARTDPMLRRHLHLWR